jgi:ParB family chromosome partitioning protein
MSKIEVTSISAIDPNPHRHLKKYPYVEKKVEALVRSFNDVGMWEGVIGRKVGNRVEIAFGHHRIEAARRAKIKEVPIIVRKLSDSEMLRFMGRENGEDYNADFLVMLETWDAAVEYLKAKPDELGDHGHQKMDAIDIAKFLGWTAVRSGERGDRGEVAMNATAIACSNASKLIIEKVLDRSDFKAEEGGRGVSVRSARDLTSRVNTRLEQFEKRAKQEGIAAEKLARVKEATKAAAKKTLSKLKAGNTLEKDVVAEFDALTVSSKAVQREPALMDVALDALTKKVADTLNTDSAGERLKVLAKVLPANLAHMKGRDLESLKRLRHELELLEARADKHRTAIDPNKVVKLNPGIKQIDKR